MSTKEHKSDKVFVIDSKYGIERLGEIRSFDTQNPSGLYKAMIREEIYREIPVDLASELFRRCYNNRYDVFLPDGSGIDTKRTSERVEKEIEKMVSGRKVGLRLSI